MYPDETIHSLVLQDAKDHRCTSRFELCDRVLQKGFDHLKHMVQVGPSGPQRRWAEAPAVKGGAGRHCPVISHVAGGCRSLGITSSVMWSTPAATGHMASRTPICTRETPPLPLLFSARASFWLSKRPCW